MCGTIAKLVRPQPAKLLFAGSSPAGSSTNIANKWYLSPGGGMVDTGDLKSPGHCDRAGSSPAPGTTTYTSENYFDLCI